MQRHVHLLLLLLLAATTFAQSPYQDVPDAKPPYYRVRYEASNKLGELAFPVQYTIWIPPGVETLRGVVVHQHGCGVGSCRSGITGAFDLHWQALAQAHRCALLSPVYEQPEKADCQRWCDPRNGSATTFLRALVDLGKASSHPELAQVPWALWGHSGGGHWCGGMVMLHPERVAAAWLRSGVPTFEPIENRSDIKPHTMPKAAIRVPMMCNLGTKEGVTDKTSRFARVWPANQAFFKQVRGEGGLLGVAVDPLTSHECGNQRYLAIRWLDICLRHRLPSRLGQPLKEMPGEDVWLAQPDGFEALQENEFEGDPKTAAWLPSGAFAKLWEQYVNDTKVTDSTPPPAPTTVRIEGNRITWQATADLESGLSHFILKRDGAFLARVPEEGKNRFGRPIFQGLQYSDTPAQPLVSMSYVDASVVEAEAGMHSYEVIAVNTAAVKSDQAIAD